MHRWAILLVFSCLSAAAGQADTTILQRALARHQAGDLEAAVQSYREYLKLRPDSVEARSNLGAALVGLGRLEEAIQEYREALSRAPANPGVLLNLALAYYKTGDIAQAVPHLSSLRSQQPDNRQVLLLLADCRLRLDENAKVIELLTPLSERDQDDLGVAYLLGTALLREKQMVRGQQLLDRILKNGESAESHLLMGTAKFGVADYPGALREFGRAVELNDKLPSVNAYYGQALMATGDPAGAAKAFRAELKQNPNDFDSNLNLATLLKQDQEYDQAMAHLDRALRVRPNDLRVRYQIATIQVAQGKTEEARKILESVIKEAPQFTEAHVSLATVYYRLKRKEDGDRERALVLKLVEAEQARQPGTGASAEPAAPAPADFDNLSQQASAARQQNRLEEAIGLYGRALELRPAWAEGWWALGTLYYDQDRYPEARDAFRKLVAEDPKAGPGFALLGLCEFRTGEYESALRDLKRARILGFGDNPQMNQVVLYHTAILLTRYEQYENAMDVLLGVVKGGNTGPSIVEAAGLAALRKPVLPAELPARDRELVTDAGLAVIAAGERRAAEAQRLFESLAARYPDTPGVHYLYGAFLTLSDPDAGLREMLKELEIGPRHLPSLVSIVFEYLKRGEAGKARPYAEAAVSAAPDSFAAHTALGRVLVELSELEKGIRELELSVRLAPDSPQTRIALASAYAKAGRKTEAARQRDEFTRLKKATGEQ